MVSKELWGGFIAMVGLLVASPGPSVLLAVSCSLTHGVRRTYGLILGDLSANIVQMMLASLGVGMILSASPQAFAGLKWGGVMYLAYLGLRQWSRVSGVVPSLGGRVSVRRLYLRGFVGSAFNPKAILFFTAIFPLFLDPSRPKPPQLLVLGVTFVALDGIALYLYARCAAHLRVWLTPENDLRWQRRITGTLLLVGAGLLAAVQR